MNKNQPKLNEFHENLDTFAAGSRGTKLYTLSESEMVMLNSCVKHCRF